MQAAREYRLHSRCVQIAAVVLMAYSGSARAATEIDVLQSEVNLLRSQVAELERDVAELRELIYPLKLEKQLKAAQQRRELCAWLRREMKAGSMSKEQAAAIPCE